MLEGGAAHRHGARVRLCLGRFKPRSLTEIMKLVFPDSWLSLRYQSSLSFLNITDPNGLRRDLLPRLRVIPPRGSWQLTTPWDHVLD